MPYPLRRTRGVLLLVLVALLLLLAGAREASARAPMVKGLQDTRLVMSDVQADRDLFWKKARQARVGRVRVLVSWDGRATKLAPDVAFRVRRAADDAAGADARLVVGIYAAVNRGRAVPRRITGTLISRFSRFTASMGSEFSDLSLGAYLTWNEPNFRSMWPLNQPRTWVRMSNAAYRSFKRTDPDTKVYVGEPAPNARTSNAVEPGTFFRRALCLDSRYRSLNRSKSCRTKLLGDGFAIHTHDFFKGPTTRRTPADAWTMGNLAGAMRQIRALGRAGRITKKASRNVHITEFAYRTHGSARTPDARAARWLRQAWNFARREGVASMTWYQLQDPGPSEEWRSGMLTGSGRELRTWRTFRSLR
ncbi:hypothetical protein [Patulibacter sp.]|uniref:hypothetical protein n=1 Tax=Patulibacter sp. TaxID=1912859 RepID=UPI0027220880|nr:hypothetical protein [Patulibacter sp.]MDO9410499.1 hypothetical protein [Patulibacter sp.]